MALNCSVVTDTYGVCSILESAGTGIGRLMEVLLPALIPFIFIVAVIGSVVLIFHAVAGLIRNSVTKIAK